MITWDNCAPLSGTSSASPSTLVRGPERCTIVYTVRIRASFLYLLQLDHFHHPCFGTPRRSTPRRARNVFLHTMHQCCMCTHYGHVVRGENFFLQKM